MIWLRRSAAIVLAVVFIVAFPAMLLLTRVNDTFGNPRFYVDQLRKADVYNYLYDPVLPAAIDELDAGQSDLPLEVGLVKDAAVPVIKQTLPPAWLQARVEDVILQVGPYLLGNTDEFSVTVPLKDRVTDGQKAVQDALHRGDTFAQIYEKMVDTAVDSASTSLSELPFELTFTRSELEIAVRKLMPQDWLLAQLDQAIDQAFPYMAGDADHFTIRVELKSRVKASGEVAIDILSRPETYDYVFDTQLSPVLDQFIKQSVPLPYGIAISREEVNAALRDILPQPWFEARLQDMVNATVAYLVGDTETLTVTLPLADRKAAILDTLDGLAQAKLRDVWQSLPECSTQEQFETSLREVAAGNLPTCRPAGISYDQVQQMLGPAFKDVIGATIIVALPNQVEITEAGLSQLIGQDISKLRQARQHVVQGLTFTDADLKKRLGTENAARLEDVRQRIKSGFTFTEADLRRATSQEAGQGEDPVASLDQARHSLKTARGWLLPGWILVVLLLAGIGALGGRKLWSKIAWAAAVLGIAALAAYVIAGPVYTGTARPELTAAISQSTQGADGVQLLVIEKANEIVYNIADTFALGVRQQSMIALAIAVIGLAAAIALPSVLKKRPWARLKDKSERQEQQENRG